MRTSLTIAIATCLGAAPLFADFSYQQTTRITGGAMAGMMKVAGAFSRQAREPIVATVSVRGNQMARWTGQHGQIIDLDKETITEINLDKKTYSVMTFAQMKQMLDDMAQRLHQDSSDKPDVNFNVSVKDTGRTKSVSGLDTHEMIVTIQMQATDKSSGQQGAMNVVEDLWIAPEVAGYEEVKDFHLRMAAKLAWQPGQGLGSMMSRPDMARAMAAAAKEAAKLKGMPVEQLMSIGGDGSAPQQHNDAGTNDGGGSKLGNVLGGLGPFGRRKKSSDDSQQSTDTSAQSGSLMEMTTEISGFSAQGVDAAKFEVPAGLKEVESEVGRRGRR